MSKILITGAKGQLGTELGKLLPYSIKTDFDTLDITNKNAVRNFVKYNDIDTIVNCAAYTAVDKAEDDIDNAYNLNVLGPQNLAQCDVKTVHISTDYVFDGTAHTPYKPDDKTNPISVYGKTKRAGEISVLLNSAPTIVIRTAWLYSPYGNNFVKTMLRLGAEKTDINVVNDQIGTPTCAADLARAIVKILPQLNTENSGIYHFTDEGVCSWYDFATEIMSMSGSQCNVHPIPTSMYPTRAVRPAYSVLDKTDIKNVFGIEIPHWRKSLQRCLGQITR